MKKPKFLWHWQMKICKCDHVSGYHLGRTGACTYPHCKCLRFKREWFRKGKLLG